MATDTIYSIVYLWKKLLTEVCNDVTLKSTLPSLTGGKFTSSSTNVADDSCLDISTTGFWTKHQMAFFDDQRVLNPNAKRYENKSLQQCYVMNEK